MTSPCGPSPSLPGTPHSEGLFWTSDQTDAEASTWQQTILTRDRHSMPPAGFEPAIPTSERQQTHVLDHAASGIGAHTYRPYFSKTHLFSNLRLFTPIDLFLRVSSTKFPHVFVSSYMFSPSQASWFYGTSDIPQRLKLWSFSLYSLLQLPVNSSLFLSNIRPPLPFSQT